MEITKRTRRIAIATMAVYFACLGAIYASHYVPYQSAQGYIASDEVKKNNGQFTGLSYENDDAREDILNMSYHEERMSAITSLALWSAVFLAIGAVGAVWALRERKSENDAVD